MNPNLQFYVKQAVASARRHKSSVNNKQGVKEGGIKHANWLNTEFVN